MGNWLQSDDDRMCQDVIVNIFGWLACAAIEKRFSVQVEISNILALSMYVCNVHMSIDFYSTSITTGN